MTDQPEELTAESVAAEVADNDETLKRLASYGISIDGNSINLVRLQQTVLLLSELVLGPAGSPLQLLLEHRLAAIFREQLAVAEEQATTQRHRSALLDGVPGVKSIDMSTLRQNGGPR